MEATQRGASITRRLLALNGRRADLRADRWTRRRAGRICGRSWPTPWAPGIDGGGRAEADLPPLLADKAQLETAMVNLATNARDAMPQGGRLSLAAATETCRRGIAPPVGLPPGRYVRLAALPTPAWGWTRQRCPGRRAVFTTKPAGAGTGLGLAMVRGFAEQSGGGLSIQSTPGRAPR